MTNSGDSSPTNPGRTSPAASPRKRFTLSGHSAILDPAVHAVRGDLADVELADRVFAPHYARAATYRVVAAVPVQVMADAASAVVGNLVVGATVDLFDLSGGWAWVRTATAIGYVPASSVEVA